MPHPGHHPLRTQIASRNRGATAARKDPSAKRLGTKQSPPAPSAKPGRRLFGKEPAPKPHADWPTLLPSKRFFHVPRAAVESVQALPSTAASVLLERLRRYSQGK